MRPGYKLDKGLSPSWSISLWHNFASACLHVLDRLQVVVIVVVAVVNIVVVDVVAVVVVVFLPILFPTFCHSTLMVDVWQVCGYEACFVKA